MGFSTKDIRKVEGGYVVEGDIFLSEKNIIDADSSIKIRIANSEQYRTTNLITGLPRVLTASITGFADPVYSNALDIAIARYNAENLKLTFQRVANNGQISIINDNTLPFGVLGQSAGFPTSTGNPPAGSTRLSSNTIGPSPDVNYLATIIAHEIGT